MVTTVTAVLGTGVETSAIYMIFCFAACNLFINPIWAFCRKATCSATRQLPEFGSVGQELTYNVQICNDGPKPLSAMSFEEWPHHPIPDYDIFANTPEPGEEKRNVVDRTLLYYRWTWLQEKERGFNILEATQLPQKINSGEKARAQFTVVPQNRGLFHFAELRVLLPDPFGLFQRCLPVRAQKDQIIILPKRYALGNFSLPGKAQLHLGGETASNSIGQTGDFLHLRDYQAGDPMRSVDWKSWARTGLPVVREYEDNFFPHYGVVLDTSGSPGLRFEEAVSVASSFVASMDTRECLLDLLFIGEKSYRITAGQGVAKQSKLLEVLATVQTRGNTDFDKLEALISRQIKHLTSLIIICPDWSLERRHFISSLQTNGINTTTFVIADDQTKEAFESAPLREVYLLHLNSLAQDLALAAAQLNL